MTAKTPAAAAPTTAWRNRITGSGEEAPDQLLANPANWRIHPKAQQDALAGALDQVGWVQIGLAASTPRSNQIPSSLAGHLLEHPRDPVSAG